MKKKRDLRWRNGDLFCSCEDEARENSGEVGLVRFLYEDDMEKTRILGFKCPDCKAIWRIEQID